MSPHEFVRAILAALLLTGGGVYALDQRAGQEDGVAAYAADSKSYPRATSAVGDPLQLTAARSTMVTVPRVIVARMLPSTAALSVSINSESGGGGGETGDRWTTTVTVGSTLTIEPASDPLTPTSTTEALVVSGASTPSPTQPAFQESPDPESPGPESSGPSVSPGTYVGLLAGIIIFFACGTLICLYIGDPERKPSNPSTAEPASERVGAANPKSERVGAASPKSELMPAKKVCGCCECCGC